MYSARGKGGCGRSKSSATSPKAREMSMNHHPSSRFKLREVINTSPIFGIRGGRRKGPGPNAVRKKAGRQAQKLARAVFSLCREGERPRHRWLRRITALACSLMWRVFRRKGLSVPPETKHGQFLPINAHSFRYICPQNYRVYTC